MNSTINCCLWSVNLQFSTLFNTKSRSKSTQFLIPYLNKLDNFIPFNIIYVQNSCVFTLKEESDWILTGILKFLTHTIVIKNSSGCDLHSVKNLMYKLWSKFPNSNLQHKFTRATLSDSGLCFLFYLPLKIFDLVCLCIDIKINL